jgi:hypothetical protein
MRTVWKYVMFVDDGERTFDMPEGARPLAVQVTDSSSIIEMWVDIPDTNAPIRERRFVATGTGHPVPPGVWVGTTKDVETGLVWHVWEDR